MLGNNQRQTSGSEDARLYLREPAGWEAKIKRGGEKLYCYQQHPGEDFFHLILGGEIYLQQNELKLCLTCAMRRGLLTRDRLHWQRSGDNSASES